MHKLDRFVYIKCTRLKKIIIGPFFLILTYPSINIPLILKPTTLNEQTGSEMTNTRKMFISTNEMKCQNYRLFTFIYANNLTT